MVEYNLMKMNTARMIKNINGELPRKGELYEVREQEIGSGIERFFVEDVTHELRTNPDGGSTVSYMVYVSPIEKRDENN